VVKAERVVLYVDGGARGNPGPSGVGVVVTDEHGNELERANDYIGVGTNNAAEYRALLLGLERARGMGAREVHIFNDSELVARQVAGQYKVKSGGLRPLHAQAMEALRSFDRWSIEPIRRERNEIADALVNEAIDARASTAG
jgi:ribonuclease HI